ncbi:Uncharacterized protein YktB, UPF0637 family [Evansella caseinilytica]|uniref:UPF0637 protein SAMN05421736_103284 n=1 Tax=Evansella caseinilytica TaxID=1503961 RepID=A0A1H3MMS7_9BACI|nr:DUF1054 domain-containing protein [Evansella caseinilytica]SDY78011.1 Uncharacterized protein YktB, UPF0637 family [Evansella caseinilytica]
MSFNGFCKDDFRVFAIEGLDARMDEIKNRVQPKLHTLGEEFSRYLAEKTGQEMYYHVAKHARRTVNPPKDTWVAFANNKRGYKMLPHFQIGLFRTHVFVWFAVIYESPVKEKIGEAFAEQLQEIKLHIPSSYQWSVDHTKPDTVDHGHLSDETLREMFHRLAKVKKAELLCGMNLPSEDPAVKDGRLLTEKIKEAFNILLPLYHISMRVYENEA